jgi:hypothetical protein
VCLRCSCSRSRRCSCHSVRRFCEGLRWPVVRRIPTRSRVILLKVRCCFAHALVCCCKLEAHANLIVKVAVLILLLQLRCNRVLHRCCNSVLQLLHLILLPVSKSAISGYGNIHRFGVRCDQRKILPITLCAIADFCFCSFFLFPPGYYNQGRPVMGPPQGYYQERPRRNSGGGFLRGW